MVFGLLQKAFDKQKGEKKLNGKAGRGEKKIPVLGERKRKPLKYQCFKTCGKS